MERIIHSHVLLNACYIPWGPNNESHLSFWWLKLQWKRNVQLISQYIEAHLDRFEQSISKQLRPMVEAMRYSIQGGGKRLRSDAVLMSLNT
ncbi:MAG: hypothetical protein H6617_02990 [Bdellovibrionaceae bacterium]|nr:hypothetical protein [Pseudobdellovibrionaceae bacterium]